MKKLKFRLCDEDRAQYGGEEWYTLDPDKLDHGRGRELERIEKEIGQPIRVVTNALNGDGTALGMRALIWLSRYQNGLREPFADFDIHTFRTEVEVINDDEGVPADAPLPDSPSTSETSG
jgi:hypothetical protein